MGYIGFRSYLTPNKGKIYIDIHFGAIVLSLSPKGATFILIIQGSDLI